MKVPGVGESITSGILAEWLKGDGELVKRDDPLYVLETDKVTLTVNASNTGWLTKKAAQGEEVKIGQVVATIETSAEKGPPMVVSSAVEQTSAASMTIPAGLSRLLFGAPTSPVVRKMIEESGLDAGSMKGSGRNGRILIEDVRKAVENRKAEVPPASETKQVGLSFVEKQTRRKVSPIRARIAERLLMSRSTTAQLTTFLEADLTDLASFREKNKKRFEDDHGVSLTYMPFVVKAVVGALRKNRALATFMVEDELIENNYYDLGIAVAAEQGLVVPVLRDADRKSLAEIQKGIAWLAMKVWEKKIALEDLQGGVFTITNAGSYGGLFGTPILNPPQSGILGVYAIEERPKVIKGEIKIRRLCYLALTYDHRVVDGKEAGGFLKDVAEYLEAPAMFLAEVEHGKI